MRPNLNTDSPEQLNRTCDICGTHFTTHQCYIRRALKRGHKPPSYCSNTCSGIGRRKLFAERFWSKVIKTDECWLWAAGRVSGGYGNTYVQTNNKNRAMRAVVASRAAYELRHGPIADDQHVCHTCDVRACVRPDHLFLGSRQDNMDDMKRKGRSARGAKSGGAKLTETQVIEIRRRYNEGGVSQEVLGRDYGVAQTQISRIVRGTEWVHVVDASHR